MGAEIDAPTRDELLREVERLRAENEALKDKVRKYALQAISDSGQAIDAAIRADEAAKLKG